MYATPKRKTIREWLSDRNRRKVAEKMGVAPSTVHRLYHETMQPSGAVLFRLAAALEIEPGQIILTGVDDDAA